MSKYKIINLFDKLFISISTFLIIFAWINFFLRDLTITFILSLIFTSAVLFLIFYLYNKKMLKTKQSKQLIEEIEKTFLNFRLMKKSNQLALIYKIITKNYCARIIENCIVYKKDNLSHLILIATDQEKITDYTFVNLLQSIPKVDCVEIICNDFSLNMDCNFLSDCKVVFITKSQLYKDCFFKHSIFPTEQNLKPSKSKFRFAQFLKNFFIPSKSKPFFLCGLVLIFSSIILPYHYYYLIFGSIFLIFSIICKFSPAPKS